MEYGPAVSPDGSHIAFVAVAADNWNSSNFQLYVQPIGAPRPLKLTGEQGDAWQPTWSPDGKHIAFLRHFGTTHGHDVLVVPVTGGSERKLGRVAGAQHGLSWSPDGRELAIVDKPSATEPDAVYLLSMEDGSKQRLTSPPADYDGDCLPMFSPDGQSLAFVRRRSLTHADIYVMSLVRRTLTHVASGRVVGGLDWTSDGRSIVFAFGEGAALYRLSKVEASGGPPQPLGVDGFEPSVARRNRAMMVYVRFEVDWNVWRVPGPLTTSPDAPAHRLIDSTQLESSPRFSPNGKRIAFISRRSGSTELWVADSDGNNPTQLTFLDRDDLEMDVAWSPDGQHLAFTSTIEGGHDIHIVSAQGGFAERVTATVEDERFPSFSHDGQWIYFATRKGGSAHQVWKVSRAGGQPVQVTQNGGLEARESPDGRFLYFTKGRNQPGPPGIWRKRLPDGEEEKIADHGDAQRWDVFDGGVCYVSVDAERRASIHCLDLNSRLAQQVAVLDKEPLPIGFSVSPDGQSIVFIRVDRNESDLMMVENFP
jgi:Tol biopolymer transport system component